MFRHRVSRTAVSIWLALGLSAAMLAGPVTTLAAPPNWDSSVEQLPDQVSPGGDAGYAVTINNIGPSNISKLYLVATMDTPVPVYVKGKGCSKAGDPLFCQLGALRAGKDVTVIVAFAAGFSDEFSSTVEANTTGATASDPGSSHGDALLIDLVTPISDEGGNFSGSFLRPGANRTVANNQTLSANNPQTTLVVSPSDEIAVTAADGPGVTADCPPPYSCNTGETSEIHVGDGTDAYGQFMVVIQIDKSAIAPGTNAGNLVVIHILDDGTAQVIGDFCAAHGPPTADCKIVDNLMGGGLQVTLWLNQNGWTKFG